MPRFVVLGRTKGMSSRDIAGRFKGLDELRDVYEVERLRRIARRRLLVFEVVEGPPGDAWYLVSFDVRGVKLHKEYSEVREGMMFSLCGHVDYSAYVCPEDVSQIVESIIPVAEVRVWPVRPYDDKTLEAVRNAVEASLGYVYAKLLKMSLRLRGRGVQKARRALELLKPILSGEARRKVEALLGLSLEDLEAKASEVERRIRQSQPRGKDGADRR